MTKNDLIALRDKTNDPEVKDALRWAINTIEKHHKTTNEVMVLLKSIRRAVGQKEDE
jgi:hypothetical protein